MLEAFAISEDDNIAEEQEQVDEVAEEPVFACDEPPHPEDPPHWPCANGSLFACSTAMRLQRTLLVQVAMSDDRCSTSTCRRVHAACAHLPDDDHTARSTEGARRSSASVRRRSDFSSEILFQLLLSSFAEKSRKAFVNLVVHRCSRRILLFQRYAL